jgi:hypothetical protein
MRLNWNWLVLIRVLLAVDGRPRVWTALKTAPIETGDIRCATPASVAAPNLALSERKFECCVLLHQRTQRHTCLIDQCRTP